MVAIPQTYAIPHGPPHPFLPFGDDAIECGCHGFNRRRDVSSIPTHSLLNEGVNALFRFNRRRDVSSIPTTWDSAPVTIGSMFQSPPRCLIHSYLARSVAGGYSLHVSIAAAMSHPFLRALFSHFPSDHKWFQSPPRCLIHSYQACMPEHVEPMMRVSIAAAMSHPFLHAESGVNCQETWKFQSPPRCLIHSYPGGLNARRTMGAVSIAAAMSHPFLPVFTNMENVNGGKVSIAAAMSHPFLLPLTGMVSSRLVVSIAAAMSHPFLRFEADATPVSVEKFQSPPRCLIHSYW